MPRTPRRPRSTALAAVLGIVIAVGVATACSTAGATGSGPAPATPPSSGETMARGGPSAPAAATESPVLPDIPIQPTGLELLAVAAELPPVRLTVPALGLDLPIDPVGVQADGQMEVPPLAERGGWYRFGSTPGGGSGTAVIAAHVDSIASAGLGPFARLKDVAVGDVVAVTSQDGSTSQFAVRSVVRVAKTEVVWTDLFTREGPHRLVLVTCGGSFQREVGRYSDNVIVIADPVGGR